MSLDAQSLTADLTYPTSRDWTTKWRTVTEHLERLRKMYEPQAATGNRVLEHQANAYFSACRSLSEWMLKDKVNLPNFTQSAIDKLYRVSRPLRICQGYVNIDKHHTPQSRNGCTPEWLPSRAARPARD